MIFHSTYLTFLNIQHQLKKNTNHRGHTTNSQNNPNHHNSYLTFYWYYNIQLRFCQERFLTFLKKFGIIKGADISACPDLAPSIRTSKVCAVSFPYLIYIAGLALPDLIGLTRLSWVCFSHSRTSAESGLLPPLCIISITHLGWFVKSSKCTIMGEFGRVSLCNLSIDKICGMWYNGNSARLNRRRAADV